MPGVLCGHRIRRVHASGRPLFQPLVRFFPAVVTGTVMLVIGLSLMRVGVNWAAGGQP